MRKGILVRRSRAAELCRVFGGLAVPVLVLGVLGSRFGVVPAEALITVLALGFALCLVTLSLGVYAFADIWKSGAEGAGSAAAGLAFASPVAAILVAVAAAAIYYPKLNDISTETADPRLESGVAAVAAGAPKLLDLEPRLYSQPIARVHAAAAKIAADRGWRITADVPPPSLAALLPAAQAAERAVEADEVLDAKATITQSRTEAVGPPAAVGESVAEPPAPIAETGLIQAVAKTPVFGFLDDVVVSLRETPAGTRVDMRSASRTGIHDLGANIRRIRSFLAELDAAVQPDPNAPAATVPVATAAGASPASISR